MKWEVDNDTYFVKNVGDLVNEKLSEGTDTISSTNLHYRECRESNFDHCRDGQWHRHRSE